MTRLAFLAAAVLPVMALVSAGVPVYVMLPLDAVTNQGALNNPGQLQSQLYTLKNAGVAGVMGDVWWGIVEPEMGQFNFTAYQQIADICSQVGIKYKPVMSVHQCGTNVGDACYIPLPSWVSSVDGIWYTDAEGHQDREYVSLFADTAPVLPGGATPVQRYSALYSAFASALSSHIGNTIPAVELSMGPAGELRYPSYQSKYWKFPGIGEFQSYDKRAQASLQAAASAAGNSGWGHSPSNAGSYNSLPTDTAFFSDGASDNYASDYGRFFLSWYSQALLDHATRVMTVGKQAFSSVPIEGKVAGVHWWYKTNSHAAEVTAGYYNTNGNDAYKPIAKVFAQFSATFDFTCLEMKDSEQPASCDCGPFELVQQTKLAAKAYDGQYGGENALNRYDSTAYSTIEQQSTSVGLTLNSFSYLRLGSTLLQRTNLNTFTDFVHTMEGL